MGERVKDLLRSMSQVIQMNAELRQHQTAARQAGVSADCLL
jgi:hypothetical protein